MTLEGSIVRFDYPVTREDGVLDLVVSRYRLVLVAKVWHSKAGAALITGLDEDRNEMRTFRVDRIIRGRIRVVGIPEETGPGA